MVTTCLGEDRIATCLASLAAQTLAPEEFEILVVQNGPPCGTPGIVADFHRAHPEMRVRLIELSQAGLGHARNVGLQAARGTYVTYVDDDDWITPGYLEGLLAYASDSIVPVALVSTVPDDLGAPGTDLHDLDNYASRSLLPFSGRTITCDKVAAALSYNAGKLVRTDLARDVRYDESLRSGEDFVYWLTLLARHPFRLHVTHVVDDVVYCRSIREGSLGRQNTGYDFMVSQRLNCLAALETVDHSDHVPFRVAARMRNGQARWINAYLKERPEEHARVMEDVRERGLINVPWQVINRGRGRDLALLYCFPPFLDTSGLVAARRLRERGVVTDVVSNDISKFRAIDNEANRVAAEVVGRTEILTTAPSFGHWDSITEFAEESMKIVDKWESESGPYRTVYSRSMAVASHFAAALLKVRRPEIEWVAEFSDPLKFHPEASERSSPMNDNELSAQIRSAMQAGGWDVPESSLFEFAELMVYALADRVVFTNDHQKDFMLGYCPDPDLSERVRAISTVSHHPTLPPDFYELSTPRYELDDTVVNIAYFGVFYVTRGLEEVMAAISSLRFEDRRRVRLHIFTSRPEALRLDVAVAGLSDVLVIRPFVPFLEFLAMTKHFDVLLVKDAEATRYFGVNPYLPSKISDYRGSGTPVWAITEPGSSLDGISTEYTSSLGDVAGARRALRAIMRASISPARVGSEAGLRL